MGRFVRGEPQSASPGKERFSASVATQVSSIKSTIGAPVVKVLTVPVVIAPLVATPSTRQ